MNQTAIITGGASGLGYSFAELLAKKNYSLILIDINEKKLYKIKNNFIQRFNTDIRIIIQDLSITEAATELYKAINCQKIDILINNVGFGVKGKFIDTDWRKENQMIQLHILLLTQLTKLVLKDMVKNKSGKILNISSMAAFQPGPLMAVYYATKAYILSFSEAIAREVKTAGVTVTALCPGPTKTNFQKTVGSEQSILVKRNWLSSPEKVVQYGYKAMMQGKTIAIPVFFDRILLTAQRFLSRKIVTTIMYQLQKKNAQIP